MKNLLALVIIAVLNISVFAGVSMAQNNTKKPAISYKVMDQDFLKRVTVVEIENKAGKCTSRIDYNFDGSILIRVFVSFVDSNRTIPDLDDVGVKANNGKPIPQEHVYIILENVAKNFCMPILNGKPK